MAVDFKSHFYLHPSDNPDQVFVRDILCVDNYFEWFSQMRRVLIAKNKFGFVDGSIQLPQENHPDFIHWNRCDEMVKGWLYSAMSKDTWLTVKDANTAHEIWADLRDCFGMESARSWRAFQLRRELASTRQDGMSVFSYYNKLTSLWGRIEIVSPTPRCTCNKCTCGLDKLVDKMQERQRLYEFVMGLDQQFSDVRTRILIMDPMPSAVVAYRLAVDDELLRNISTREKAAPPRRDESKPRCSYCRKKGHIKDACYKLVGYPSR